VSQVLPLLTSDDLPPSPNRNSWIRRVVVVVVAVGLALAVVFSVVFVRSLAPVPAFTGGGSGTVVVVVSEGDTLSTVAQTLAEAGVVSAPEGFINVAELDPRSAGIQPGAYTLRMGMSPSAALDLMLDPTSRSGRMVVAEGLRPDAFVSVAVNEARLSAADVESVLDYPKDIALPRWAHGRTEGLLFPASYDLIPGMTATELVSMMVDRFNQAADQLDLTRRAARLGYSPWEVLIVASLAQAEARPQDMAKVARVAYNRLDSDMRLQFDSTVNYALGTSTFLITGEMLAVDSPYNTFLTDGLPPTPINSPGEAAIEAALSPEAGDWLYFVTVDPDTGRTKFTSDYDEFLVFKSEFKRRYAAQREAQASQ